MASSEFICPHCHNPIKVIALTGTHKQFQSTASASPEPAVRARKGRGKGFWASLTATYLTTALLAGGFVWLVTWLYEFNPVWAVVTGLIVGVGLPVLELVLNAPARPAEDKPKPHVIRIEQISEDEQHWLLNELDDRITLNDLIKVPKAVDPDQFNETQRIISRRKLRRSGLSKSKAQLILDEFKRLGYAYTTAQNRTFLTRGGKAFVRECETLPHYS